MDGRNDGSSSGQRLKGDSDKPLATRRGFQGRCLEFIRFHTNDLSRCVLKASGVGMRHAIDRPGTHEIDMIEKL